MHAASQQVRPMFQTSIVNICPPKFHEFCQDLYRRMFQVSVQTSSAQSHFNSSMQYAIRWQMKWGLFLALLLSSNRNQP